MRLRKKGAIEEIVPAIIALLVVLSVAFIVSDMIFGKGNVVAYLLGFGNVSAFDKDIVQRFNETQTINADAITSVNSLLYATNALAFLDTNKKDASEYKKYEKNFTNTIIKHTVYNGREIFPSGSKEELSKIIVKNIIECKKIFMDKGNENTGCFMIDSSRFNDNVEVTSEDVQKMFDSYYNDPECDDKCKEYIFDIAGYYGANPYNWIFNVKNWAWDSGLTLKKGVADVRICGDNSGFNKVHITTNSETCKMNGEDQAQGFVIQNFNLPQQVDTSTSFIERWLNAYGDPEYIIYYEKFPEGEEEYWKASSYNVAVGSILTVEGVFFLFDIGTVGFGKFVTPTLKRLMTPPLKRLIDGVIHPILETAKGGISKFTPTFLSKIYKNLKEGMIGVFEAVKEGLKDIVLWPFRRAMLKTLTYDMAEDAIQGTARTNVESILKRRLSKDAFEKLDEATVKAITDRYIAAFKSARQSLEQADEDLVENGVIKSNAQRVINFEMDKALREIRPEELSQEAIETRAYAIWQRKGSPMQDAAGQAADWDAAVKELLGEQNSFITSLKGKIGANNLENVISSIKSDSIGSIEDASLRKIPLLFAQRYKSAARAADRIRAVAEGDLTKEEREQLIEKIIKEGTEVLDNMNPNEAGKFLVNRDTMKVVDYVFQNGDFVWDIGGKKFTAAEKAAAAKAFDDAVEKLAVTEQFKYAAMVKGAFGQTAAYLNPIQQRRHIVAVAAAVAAIKIESMNAKFVSAGTNAFGLKTPLAAPIAYDEMENVKTDAQRADFFKHFGEPGYQGMLPEANRYWMSLTRDKNEWWWNQDPARFHLVSPCKADILMSVSTCTCIGKPLQDTMGASESWIGSLFENQGVYETGTPNNQLFEKYPNRYTNGMQPNFDGATKSLFTLDENGEPVKQCNPSGEWFTFGEKEYKISCIKFDPLLDESTSPNYCYHGLNPLMSVANAGLNYALPIGLALAGGVVCEGGAAVATVGTGGVAAPSLAVGPAVCGAIGGAIGGITGSLSYAYINTYHQWPNHS